MTKFLDRLDPSMKSDGKVQNHEMKELSIKTKVCNKWLNKIVNYTKKKLHAETSKKICFSSLYISIEKGQGTNLNTIYAQFLHRKLGFIFLLFTLNHLNFGFEVLFYF